MRWHPVRNSDFSRNCLARSLARTAELTSLGDREQRALSRATPTQYLRQFVIVEELTWPSLLDHSQTMLRRDPSVLRALLETAGKAAKQHPHARAVLSWRSSASFRSRAK